MKTQPVNVILLLSAFIVLFTACSQEDEVTYQLNSKLVELRCGKTFALEVSPTLSGLTYTSLNTNIATVTSSGVVKAGLVGTTKVVVKDSLINFVDTVSVAVTSIHAYFQCPYLGFGSTQQTVRDNVSYPLEGLYYEDGINLLIYSLGTNSYIKYLLYYFNDNSRCVHVKVRFDMTQDEDLDEFVADNYTYIITKEFIWNENSARTTKFYINPDSSCIVLLYFTGACLDLDFHPANQAVIDQVLTSDTVVFMP